MIRKTAVVLVFLLIGMFPVFHLKLNGIEVKHAGFKYYKNYSYLEYDHHPQNWCILQDKNGVIYVGNTAGVLVYDGVNWKVINIPNMLVRSMAIGEDKRIYVGGKNEVGCLAPNNKGFLEYVSLTNHIDEKYKNFSDAWNTIATKEGVYFRSSGLLFRWNYEKFDMYIKGGFGALYSCGGELLIQRSGKGLMKVEGNSLKQLPGNDILGKKRIRMLASYDTGGESTSYLLGTRSRGLEIYTGGELRPFKTTADDYLKKNRISHGIDLSTGEFAVATMYGGLVILDANGNARYIFNKASGLQDNNVKYIYEDNLGNLWLALSKGISRLEYRSPFYHYEEGCGLDGIARTVIRHKDNYYAGTTQGLYVLHPDADTFTPINGIGTCLDLLSSGHSLLAATANGIYHIDPPGGVPEKIFNIYTFKMASSRLFPGHIWCASKKGLVTLTLKEKRWTAGYSYEKIDMDIRNIIEAPSGHLWIVTATGNLMKVTFPDGIAHPGVKNYDQEEGLFQGDIFPALLEGNVAFASRKGLSRYYEKDDSFIPFPLLGKKYTYGPDAAPVFRIAQDRNRYIWFHSESRNYRAIPGSSEVFRVDGGLFRRIPLIQVNSIYPDRDGKDIWFAGLEGLIRYDSTVKVNWDSKFSAMIREVLIDVTTPIFGGYRNSNGNQAHVPELPYKDRNISFRCAAPFFEKEKNTLFRYKLDGYDKNWSEWTTEPQKYYTNLDGGWYNFRVQAKNIYEVVSREDTFRFRVLPPWYKTWWAFILYAVALLILFYYAVKWRSHKLIREKERLEQVVEERTGKIREQAEKLEEMDKIKSRFFANISHEFRTPLTLIMSPLEQLLSQKKSAKQENIFRVILRNAQQLLTLINQLLDLSRFDSGKMKLRAAYSDIVPLLKSALASFQALADRKELSLELNCREEEIYIYFDTGKIEEVMYNLLSNAVKFTPSGGQITVSLFAEPQHIVISVKDTGIGIPDAQSANIFDRFFQAGNGQDKTGKGTGIGLALTKEIITLHHGTIDVNSREGQGTEFVIHLPRGKDHLEQDEIVLESTTSEGGRIEEIDDMDTEPVKIDISGESETEEPGKPEILVVEDHRDMREHIRSILEPDYRVIEAVNGKDGMAKAKELIPALIVSDIMMPEMDGFELCRQLKKDIRTSHIPNILLTARASDDSIMRGLETGADDYVTKPFNADMLLTRIKNLIDLRSQLQLKIQREKMLLPSEVSVSSQDDQFLKEFQAVIGKNLDNPDFSIDVLSNQLLIGRSTLFKKIQALTGETPNQFIQSYRLERGAQLLRENYGNVTQVAMAVGFTSPQYFSRCFKEKFHQSPKAFQAAESKAK